MKVVTFSTKRKYAIKLSQKFIKLTLVSFCLSQWTKKTRWAKLVFFTDQLADIFLFAFANGVFPTAANAFPVFRIRLPNSYVTITYLPKSWTDMQNGCTKRTDATVKFVFQFPAAVARKRCAHVIRRWPIVRDWTLARHISTPRGSKREFFPQILG